MKKLMVVAAAAMLGISANAAVALNWNGTWAYDHTDSDLAANTMAYLVDANIYTALFTDTAAGTFDTTSVGIMATTKTTYNDNDGANIFAQPGDINAINSKWTTAGQSADLYTVFIDGDWVGISQAHVATQVPADGNVLAAPFGEFSDYDSGANLVTWTQAAAPVPEPTSGLMLLLGVAGLALKRRRA